MKKLAILAGSSAATIALTQPTPWFVMALGYCVAVGTILLAFTPDSPKLTYMGYEQARVYISVLNKIDAVKIYDITSYVEAIQKHPYLQKVLPSNPEYYYKESGEWVSWEHFTKL